MMNPRDPVRLVESLEAPPSLRSLLERAHGDVPSLAQKERLVRAALGRGIGAGPAIQAGTSGVRWAAAIARHSTKLLSAAAVVGVGAGALYIAGVRGEHFARSPEPIGAERPFIQDEQQDEGSRGGLVEGLGARGNHRTDIEPIGALPQAPSAPARSRSHAIFHAARSPSSPTGFTGRSGDHAVASRQSQRSVRTAPGERSETARPEARPEAKPFGSKPSPAKAETVETGSRSDWPMPEEPLFAAASSAEATLLRSAREALATSPARTLSLTNEHIRRYPRGILDQEREALAIEALMKLGRVDEARARAREFELAYPASPHGARVQRALRQ